MGKTNTVRYIGIDFGTSTSVVCYMDYTKTAAGQLKADPAKHPNMITFGNSQTVPTIIQVPGEYEGKKLNDYSFGEAAENKIKQFDSLVYQNFKMDLTSSDPEKRQKAEELLDKFFGFLYDTYKHQRNVPEGEEIEEYTMVSYPVKWPFPVIEKILDAAKRDAVTGTPRFKNVKGMDEPTAAMQYFLTNETEEKKNIYKNYADGESINILLLDMGAGTTDMVLYKYKCGKSSGHEVYATWPPLNDEATFGGREIDRILKNHVDQYLDPLMKKKFKDNVVLSSCKDWKEKDISPNLKANLPVEEIASGLVMAQDDSKTFDPIDRAKMGELLSEYLPTLPNMIKSIIREANKNGFDMQEKDIDVVLYTGGHSQWYFVEDILRGKWVPGLSTSKEEGSGISFEKIKAAPWRLMTTAYPQQIVARGLAMTGVPVSFKPRSKNNIWFEFKVGNSARSVTRKVMDKGKLLPCTQRVLFEVDGTVESGKDIPFYIIPKVGTDEAAATSFSQIKNTAPMTTFDKIFDGVIGFFAGSWEYTTKSEFWMECTFDEGENMTGIGFVKMTYAKGFNFFAIKRGFPGEQEKKRLLESYKSYKGK